MTATAEEAAGFDAAHGAFDGAEDLSAADRVTWRSMMKAIRAASQTMRDKGEVEGDDGDTTEASEPEVGVLPPLLLLWWPTGFGDGANH